MDICVHLCYRESQWWNSESTVNICAEQLDLKGAVHSKCKSTTQGRGLPIIYVKMIGSMLAKFDISQSMAWIRRTISAGWIWTEGVRVYSIPLHEQTGQHTVSLRQTSPHWWGIAVKMIRQNSRANMSWLVKETIKGGLHLIPIRDEVDFKLNQLQFCHLQLSNADKSSYSKWNG